MKESEFCALLIRLDPSIQSHLNLGHSRVMAAYSIAGKLWMKRHPEDEDTEKLRDQLAHLNQFGHFNFTQLDMR